MNVRGDSAFDKILPLTRIHGSVTEEKTEQAGDLIKTFFPPLPTGIEDEGERSRRAPMKMVRLTEDRGARLRKANTAASACLLTSDDRCQLTMDDLLSLLTALGIFRNRPQLSLEEHPSCRCSH